MHGFCVGNRAPILGGRLVMDVDKPDAAECGVEPASDGSGGVGADDALSVGAVSAGVESAKLSSEGHVEDGGAVVRSDEAGLG